MEEKELNELLSKVDVKVKEAAKTEVQSALEGTLKASDLETRLKEMGIDKDAIKEAITAVEKQGEEINRIRTQQPQKLISINDWMQKNMETLRRVQSTKEKAILTIPMVNKAVTVGSSVTNITGYLIPGFEDMPLPPTDLDMAFTRMTIPAGNEGSIYYTDQTTNTNNAAMATEGTSGTDSAHAWTRTSQKVVKALATEKISYEALTDLPEMNGTLQRLLSNGIRTVKTGQLYTGAGTTIYPKGAYTGATAFDSSAYTGAKIQNCNIYDLAKVLKAQIRKNYGGKFMPNIILLNDEDALVAELVKDELGQYVRNPFISPDGSMLGGMKIVVSPYVTQDTMVVGDFRFAYLYEADSIEIELGYDTGDFDDDLMTMKARHRFCTIIRSVDAYGFLKVASIETALGNITVVGS